MYLPSSRDTNASAQTLLDTIISRSPLAHYKISSKAGD